MTGRDPFVAAERIAVAYVIIGTGWILASDSMLLLVLSSGETLTRVQSVKGIGFVAVTGAALYGMLRRQRGVVSAAFSELATRNEALNAVFDASPVPTMSVTSGGVVSRWNAAAEDTFGWSTDEIVGGQYPVVPPGKEGENVRLRERVTNGEVLRGVETRRRRKDGSLVDVAISAAPIAVEGEVEEHVVVLVDISEVKRRERVLGELHESTRRMMTASTPEAVFEILIETVDTVLGHTFGGAYRYDDETGTLEPVLATERAREELPPQRRFESDEASLTWAAFEAGTVRRYDDISREPGAVEESAFAGEIIAPIGRYGVLNIVSHEVGAFDESDESIATLLVSNAEAAFHRLERETYQREEHAFIERTLDAMADVFVFVTSDGELNRWNRRYATLTGIEMDALAEPNADLVTGPVHEALAASLGEALDDGNAEVEFTFETTNGESRRVEFGATRIDDVDGDPLGVSAIGRDVTERERLRTALEENERRYRTLVEMSPLSVVVLVDGVVEYANRSFVSLVGARPDDFIGTAFTAFLRDADRDRLTEIDARVQSGLATPTITHEVVTLDGVVRSVETTSRAIAFDGVPAVMKILEDVTERRRFERSFRALLGQTEEMVLETNPGDLVADTLEALDGLELFTGAAFYAYDEEQNALVPTGSPALHDGSLDAISNDESPVWEAYATRTVTRGSLVEADDASVFRDVVAFPVRNRGVLAVGADPSLSMDMFEFVEIFANTLAAALDRVTSEQAQRNIERRLVSQNEELVSLNHVNELIRAINEDLVSVTTVDEIADAICGRVTAVESFRFAWLGRFDENGTLSMEVATHVPAEYASSLDGEPFPDAVRGLVRDAASSKETQVNRDIVTDPDWEPVRRDALSYGFNAVAAVPILVGDHVEYVLVVHATSDAFIGERGREVFTELGRTIGHAISMVRRRETIGRDVRVDVKLSIDDDRLFVNRLVEMTGGVVTYHGAIARGENTVVYVSIDEQTVEGWRDEMAAWSEVAHFRVIGEETAQNGTYELVVSTPPILDVFRRYGAVIQDITADRDGTRITVELLPDVAVRGFIENVAEKYDDVALVGRSRRTSDIVTGASFVSSLTESLTPRQYESITAAYFSGFYEWPRNSTSEELAELLGISSPTYQYHRRAAERKLIAATVAPVVT